VQRLHALDVTTGLEKFGGPQVIVAKVKGSGDGSHNGVLKFDPLRQHQRVSLLLQNGTIYISWASHCDIGPYHAWVISYDAGTLIQTGVWNSTPNGGLGGVWQSGDGLAGDAGFNLYFATGNGTFDVNQAGRDFGDSIVKLNPPTQNRFRVADFFTPDDQDFLNQNDLDLGSGGVVLLPDQSGAHQHVLVQAGKEGTIYLIDRDHLGHFDPNTNHVVQELDGAVGGMWAGPGWWNNNLYFGGSGDYLKLYTFNPATGLISTSPASESPTFFGFPGPSPSISANGNSNGIVWVLQTDDYGNGSATLHAYNATNVASELYNSGQNSSRDDPGGAVKFTVPSVANGKVYVPAVQKLSVYGLLSGHQSSTVQASK
jgi:hypothetical protein